jgi:hypothetical protein
MGKDDGCAERWIHHGTNSTPVAPSVKAAVRAHRLEEIPSVGSIGREDHHVAAE